MKVDHSLMPFTKINLKWIKDLRVKPKTVRLLEEYKGSTLFDISLKMIFSDTMSSQTRETIEKKNHMGLHHTKELLQGKGKQY